MVPNLPPVKSSPAPSATLLELFFPWTPRPPRSPSWISLPRSLWSSRSPRNLSSANFRLLWPSALPPDSRVRLPMHPHHRRHKNLRPSRELTTHLLAPADNRVPPIFSKPSAACPLQLLRT